MTGDDTIVTDDSLLSQADRALFKVETVANLVAAFSIFFLMFLGVANIASRNQYFFDAPLRGYTDFVEQAIAVFAFLAVSYCQRLGGHVRMDLLLRALKGRALWIAETLSVCATIFIVVLLIDASFDHFLRAFTQGDSTIDIELPVWPSKLLVPIALSLLLLRLLVQLCGYLRLVRWPDAAPVAVPTIPTIEDQARLEIEEVYDMRTSGEADSGGRTRSGGA